MKQSEIYKMLPHRYPMLFVDDIIEIEYGKYVKGVKNVSNNEPWATGHFPEEPVFPGVLLLETLAQIGGFMFYNKDESKSLKAYLSKIEDARFIQKVIPGQQIVVEAKFLEKFSRFAKLSCVGKVNEKIVVKAIVIYFFESDIF